MNNTGQIMEMINKMYNDTSIDIDEVVDSLETIIENTQELLDAL